jgi:hypothetical protein
MKVEESYFLANPGEGDAHHPLDLENIALPKGKSKVSAALFGLPEIFDELPYLDIQVDTFDIVHALIGVYFLEMSCKFVEAFLILRYPFLFIIISKI